MQPLPDLWEKEEVWRRSIASKLTGLWDSNQLSNLNRCGQERNWRTCKECGEQDSFAYHCSLRWCPRCQNRVVAQRMHQIKRWSQTIKQPKHLVLTQRNFPVLTHRALQIHRSNLSKLRRQPVMRQVRGGCVSVEVTNEQRGWHLHSHWLVDARWVDASELAIAWGRLVGQEDNAIVKVKQIKDAAYCAEILKYVAKGSQIAAWPPHEILEFVRALQGTRFFFRFGTLFKLKLPTEQHDSHHCSCGSCNFIIRSERDQEIHDILQQQRRRKRR